LVSDQQLLGDIFSIFTETKMHVPVLPLVDEQGRHGIVFSFRFDEEGLGTQMRQDDMPSLPVADDCFWWIHLNLADARCRAWIADLDQLPDEARDILLSQDKHDRVELEGDVLAGVFLDARLDFASASEDMAQLRFVLAERLLLTGRRHSLQSIESIRAAVEAGRRVETAIDLLEAIVDREADAIGTSAIELGQAVDSLEDKILAGYADEARDGISGLRRRAVKLNRQLSRLLGLFRRVERAPTVRWRSEIREAAGRIAQRLESIHQEVHASQDRARLLQDEVSAYLAAQTNRQLYVLSMLTAVFLPATLVTGLFGMNTKGLPFSEEEGGFWFACLIAVLAAIGVYILLIVAMRRGHSRG
jgi:zinc transporter